MLRRKSMGIYDKYCTLAIEGGNRITRQPTCNFLMVFVLMRIAGLKRKSESPSYAASQFLISFSFDFRE
jgi:hypothetical protein